MSEENKSEIDIGGGLGFLGFLALIFITLKLVGKITWSWWYVLAPLWGPWAILLTALVAFLICVGITELWKHLFPKTK